MQKTSKLSRDGAMWGLLMVAPTIIGLLVLNMYPFLQAIYMSFSKSLPFGEFEFEGIENYVEMFQNTEFWKATGNTILFCVLTVPLGIFLALLVAVLLNSKIRGRTGFRAIFFLPMVVAPAAVAMVWKWIFNVYYGVLNQVLGTNQNWLGDEKTAIWCIIMILFTTSIGQPIVLYVAALGNVDQSLVEAAQVDGATKLQVFWKIKWPQIMPTTLYILVITTINSFQCFALIQLLTSGGPNGSTNTIMYYIFDMVYRYNDFGYANAMGVILAIIIAIFSAIQFKFAKTDNG